jgi:hypothetical protein
MKKTALALSALLAINLAHAETRSYAVLSLAGDTVTTMTFVRETGTRINPNSKDVYALNNSMFDETAIRSASAAIQKAEPGTAPFLMLSLDGELHKAQNAMFDAPAGQQENRAYLKSLWKDHPVSHLILVSKFLAETEVKYQQTTEGSGKVEGLGFYMDNRADVVVHNDKQNYESHGILMPFAYLKLRLVDADTLAVLGEVTEKASEIVAYPPEVDRDVRTWGTLTAKQKVDYLDRLVDRAVKHAIPKLLAPDSGARRAPQSPVNAG